MDGIVRSATGEWDRQAIAPSAGQSQQGRSLCRTRRPGRFLAGV